MKGTRCVSAVVGAVNQLNLQGTQVELGMLRLKEDISVTGLERLQGKLNDFGFELVGCFKSRLVDRVHKAIDLYLSEAGTTRHLKLSVFIASQVNREYRYLSSLFSSIEGTTIEKVCIKRRIERASKLLEETTLSVSQIAAHLGYASIQHLSAQFKGHMGSTPSTFRRRGVSA